MAFDPHANFVYGVVAVAPVPALSGTTLELDPAYTALFPDPGTRGYNCTVWPAGTSPPLSTNATIVRVTAKIGNLLVIIRNQEEGYQRAIEVGDQIIVSMTAKVFTDIEAAVSSGGITALNGDGTATGPGLVAFTLTTVNANVGTFGSVTKSAIPTVNAKGLITGIIESTITPAVGSITGLGTGVATALAIATNASGGVLTVGGGGYEVPLTFSTGLTRTVNTVTVNASQSIATLSNLTSNGLVTTSGGVGTLGVTVPGTGVLTALGVNVGTSGAFVVNSTTVAGHALTSNVSISASDVGLGSVTNDAQTKAAIVPNTTPTAGQLLIGNAGATAYAPVTISGDVTINSAGATTIGNNKVNGFMISLSSEVAGNIMYYDNTNWVCLANDTGKYLKSGGAAPSWDTPSGTGDMTKAVYDPQNAGFISGDDGASSGGVLKMGADAIQGGSPGGSIFTYGGSGANASGGYIITFGGATASASGGFIQTIGDVAPGGNISTHGGSIASASGGSIATNGGTAANAFGGSVNTSGGGTASANGGSINVFGGTVAGGSITTSNGGGSIDTTGTGSIQLGIAATRTTFVGSATAARTITLPDSTGTVALTNNIPFTPNLLTGGTISSDTSDPTNDIDIEACSTRNSADTANMVSTALVKQQDAVWAVGTNAGGMYQSAALTGTIATSGSSVTVTGTSTTFLTDYVVGDVITDTTGAQSRRIATITNDTSLTVESVWTVASSSGHKRGGKAKNTHYYIYLIRRSDTGVVDAFFTTRNPGQTVTLPTSYDSSRLIGGFNNNGTPAVDAVMNTNGFKAYGYQTLDYVTTLATNVDTGLFFYCAASERWSIFMDGVETSPAAGTKFQITAPTSATFEGSASSFSLSSTLVSSIGAEMTAINALSNNAVPASLTVKLNLNGSLFNSTNAGTVAIGAASTTGTQTTTIKAKAFFRATRR